MTQENNQIIDRARAIDELWRRGVLKYKLHDLQKRIYDSFYNDDNYITTMLISRQTGKCLAEGTEVMTPTGPVPIEELEVGDIIYGFNKDASVSETRVLAKQFQGIKDVVPLYNNGRLLAESTEDHRWLFYNTATNNLEELPLKDAGSHKKIKTEYVDIPFGEKNVPQAYAIGALLGDGCSRQGIKQIHISSENDIIPKKVASLLKCNYWKNSKNNYTWALSLHEKGLGKTSKYSEQLTCEYYDEWCKGRYAAEKVIDIKEIRSWDRDSILNLLAGLIDTDGSVFVCKTNNQLVINFSSNSLSLCYGVQFIIQSLVQYRPTIIESESRPGQYSIKLSNNLFSKRLLKILSPYLCLEGKQWKPEYENLRCNNQTEKYIGVRKKDSIKKPTWDIQVDNDTNLYLLANGMVTHNSFLLGVFATETCLRKEHSVVKFVTPKQRSGKNIIKKVMREILADCPPDLKPEWKENDKIYLFPNGSEIQLAGTDNQNYDNVRGGTCDLWIVDEAGFCSDLETVIYSVLLPTTTVTKGRGIMSSTPPPDDPEHDFIRIFIEQAELEDRLFKFTIDDNPQLTDEEKRNIESRYIGGRLNPKFKAEYLCEVVRDSDSMVVPEFDAKCRETNVVEWERPPFYDAYVAMDIGYNDLTVILFGYYDFKNAVHVIEDEYFVNGPELRTDSLAKTITKIERDLYTHPETGEFSPPYLRVADNNNLILLNDLLQDYNILFIPTRKDNKEAALNDLRVKFSQDRIKINPKCKVLIHHLKNATWDKKRKSYAKSPEATVISNGETFNIPAGHYDAVDSILYFVRNVLETKNPYPVGYGLSTSNNLFIRPGLNKDNKKYDKFVDMFRPKRSLKVNKSR